MGFSCLPASHAFAAAGVKQMEAGFAEAKSNGPVRGEPVKRVMTDPATMNPAEQPRSVALGRSRVPPMAPPA